LTEILTPGTFSLPNTSNFLGVLFNIVLLKNHVSVAIHAHAFTTKLDDGTTDDGTTETAKTPN